MINAITCTSSKLLVHELFLVRRIIQYMLVSKKKKESQFSIDNKIDRERHRGNINVDVS